MCVDGGIPCGSGEVLALSVGDVLAVPLDVPFCQSEVNQKYFMRSFVESHTKVIRFDVSMYEMSVVNILNSLNHLVDEHEHRFKREFA